jgi:AmmeMemoRadiSam system protein B
MLMVRPPIVAGQFYDVDPVRLRKQIQSAMSRAETEAASKRKTTAAVVPHAGYVYSGWVAAYFYSMIGKDSPKNYIIIGPNHSLAGSNYAIMKKGLWKTPLGSAMVDEDMADSLLKRCELVEQDVIPHQYDHSIEVQLPFLQYVVGSDLKFVPLAIKSEVVDSTLLEGCRIVGKAVAGVVKGSKNKWGIISTSDFSHYVPQKLAEDVDNQVIKQIVKLNEKSFFDSINERNASMCGAGAVATAIVAAKMLGAKSGRLLKYATSADTTGDTSAVVGYASIIM